MAAKNSQPNKNDPEKEKEAGEASRQAFDQALEDIEKDPELRTDEDKDLDEGELARKEGHP